MKRSNAQYTWFLIYLTEQSLFTLYRMRRHQIIATYPCKHQSLREAAISVLGMIRRILGSRSSFRRLPWSPLKNLIVVTLTTICISLSACCCIHFVEVRFFGAWLAGVPCQSHCNPFHSRHCQMPMDGSGSWSALSSSRISYLPHFYGSRLCVVLELWGLMIRSIRWSICGEVNSPVVCWIRCSNESLRCKFYFLLLQWLFCIAD